MSNELNMTLNRLLPCAFIQDISEHEYLTVMGFHMSQGHIYHGTTGVQQNLHCSSRHCQAGGEGCTRERRVVHHTCQLAE